MLLPLGFVANDYALAMDTVASAVSSAIAIGDSREVEIRSPDLYPIDYKQVKAPPFRTWPVVRRILVGCRDRSRVFFS